MKAIGSVRDVKRLLNLPLWFASDALFPISFMPEWLEAFAQVNPVTYGTDAPRNRIRFSPNRTSVANDFLFREIFAAIFATIGIVLSWRYLSK